VVYVAATESIIGLAESREDQFVWLGTRTVSGPQAVRLAGRIRRLHREWLPTDVTDYIAAQQEHHRRVSFQEEFLTFLRKQEM